MALGLDEVESKKALRQTGGDVERAVDLIFSRSQPESPVPPPPPLESPTQVLPLRSLKQALSSSARPSRAAPPQISRERSAPAVGRPLRGSPHSPAIGRPSHASPPGPAIRKQYEGGPLNHASTRVDRTESTGDAVKLLPPPPFVRGKVDFKVEGFVDCRDKYGMWLQAEIIAANETHVRIHFIDWDEKWDEDIPKSHEHRFAPFRKCSMQGLYMSKEHAFLCIGCI
eukprot:1324705-Amorphochlora_amoeboformis.AAC.2